MAGGQSEGGHGGVKGPPDPPTHTMLPCALRVDVANRLESSLQQSRELLASYENRLIRDDTMPESGHVLDSKRQELEVNLGSGSHGVLSLCSGHLPPSPDEDVRALKVWSSQQVILGTKAVGSFLAVPRVCKSLFCSRASMENMGF